MAGNIKGITIEINGDTTKLEKSLSSVDKQTSSVNKELKQVNNLLKFNPGNTDLIAQKQQLLAKQVQNTSDRLSTLKGAQAQVDAQFKAGKLPEDQYRAFQREIIATEGKLDNYKGQLKQVDTSQSALQSSTKKLNAYFEASGKSVDDYADVLGSKLVSAIKEGKASSAQLDTAIDKIGKTVTDSRDDFDQFKSAISKIDDGGSVAGLKDDLTQLESQSKSTGDQLDQIADNTFSEKMQNMGDAMSDIGGKIQDIGTKMTDAWSEMDDAVDNLTSKTGVTGSAADELGASYEKVESSMAGSQMESEDLSNTMAGLRTQFDLSGKALETTSESVAKFSAITGQSGTEAVQGLHDTMAKFKVKADEIPSVLDALAKGAQTSGMDVGNLQQSVADAYPVFAQLNIPLKDGIGIIASWSKAGLDSTQSLKAMQKASAVFSKENKTMEQGLTDTFNAIKNSKSPMDAMNEGVKVFGTRNAPQMVQAIKDGKLSLEDLKGAAVDSTGTVNNSFKQTLDPIDKATQAQKKMQQSMAEMGGAILTQVAPALQQVAKFVQNLVDGFNALPGPVQDFIVAFGGVTVVLGILAPIIAAFATMGSTVSLVAVAIAAAIAGIILVVKNWGSIVKWLKDVWGSIVSFFQPLMTALGNVFNSLKPVLDMWKQFFKNTINNVKTAISGMVDVVKGILDIFAGIFTGNGAKIKQGFVKVFQGMAKIIGATINQMLNTVVTVFTSIVNAISRIFQGAVKIVSRIWSSISGFFTKHGASILSGVKKTFSNVVNAITHPMETAKRLVSKAISAIKGFFNFKVRWPHISMPRFSIKPSGWKMGDLLKGKIPTLGVSWHADGGIFTKPTLFAGSDGSVHGVGEAGAEAVAPLDKLMGYVQQAVASTVGVGTEAQIKLLQQQNSMLAEMLSTVVDGVPAYVDWNAGARKMAPAIQKIQNATTKINNRRVGNL